MADNPARLRVGSPADLLSYVPHLLGFVPAESLVVLTLSARRVGATLRVDLPRPGTDLRVFAAQVVSFLRADTGADSTVAVLYTDAEWSGADHSPHRRMVHELQRSLGAAGFGLEDAWVVSSRVWRNYFCTDPECCPSTGRPVAEIAESRLSAELIYGGSSVVASVEAAVEPVPGPDPGLDARRRAVESFTALYRTGCGDAWTLVSQFRETMGVWEAAVRTGENRRPPEPETAAFLLASLEAKAIRDSVLVLAALGREAAERGAEACNVLSRRDPGRRPLVPPPFRRSGQAAAAAAAVAPEPADARRYAGLLAGTSDRSPQWDRLDSACRLLIQLAAVASGESAAAVHSMLGWIEFARGRGSRAAVYLGRAERAWPGYRLAVLLKELIDHGGMPGWARHPETAWTAGGPSLR